MNNQGKKSEKNPRELDLPDIKTYKRLKTIWHDTTGIRPNRAIKRRERSEIDAGTNGELA